MTNEGWTALMLGITGGGAALAVGGTWLGRRGSRVAKRYAGWRRAAFRCAGGLAFGVAGVAGTAGAVTGWWRLRPQPDATQRAIDPSIHYERVVLTDPSPTVVHIARIDLRDPDLKLVVTPSNPGRTLPARTTLRFAERFDVVLAINAQFFWPFETRSPIDFRPQAGDPVYVVGRSVASGTVVQPERWHGATLWFDADNHVYFGDPPPEAQMAVSGRDVLVLDGTVADLNDHDGRQPRTVAGFDAAREILLLFVIDGRQPGFSEGMTLPELATFVRDAGATTAIELDGGGSSTMVAQAQSGELKVLNSPIHTRIPGRQRFVANHLGVGRRGTDRETTEPH